MLHVTQVLDSLNPQFLCLHDQEEGPEAGAISNPEALKVSRKNFAMHFKYLSVTGPHQAVNEIQVLCRQWLQPETHTKEQMMERLVLEQFLSTLPEEVRTWVRSRHPRNSKEAGTLVAYLIKKCGMKETGSQVGGDIRVRGSVSHQPGGHQFPKPDVISRLEEEAAEEGRQVLAEDSAVAAAAGCPGGEEPPQGRASAEEQRPPAEEPAPRAGGVERVHRGPAAGEPRPDGPAEPHSASGASLSGPVSVSDPTTHTRGGGPGDGEPAGPPGAGPMAGDSTSPRPKCGPLVSGRGTLSRCGFCPRTFSAPGARARHEQVHTGTRPFQCQQCGQAFYLVPHLTRHQRTRCRGGASGGGGQGCREAFLSGAPPSEHPGAREAARATPPGGPRSRTYSIRYQRRRDDVGDKLRECCDCGRVFGRTSHLVQHQRVHAQERPYQCGLCGRCFGRPSNLTQHYQLHSQRGPPGRGR
ncbi:Zinc finger imprinted 2 [Galemys pyrenaicus]|uniref:SCAN domain-containing protein 1 n=1 Tax=Galemys pyrenaicus TaxID=202257 RepID=A0A8J5ZZZ2_GALPY|nr:Zinc finger imprinted 2 [Galemys pyrenaicus]